MAKYNVSFHTGASSMVSVEADDEEEAIDKAYDELPSEVCAQCSGWRQSWSFDIGDWEMDEGLDGFPNPELVTE